MNSFSFKQTITSLPAASFSVIHISMNGQQLRIKSRRHQISNSQCPAEMHKQIVGLQGGKRSYQGSTKQLHNYQI